MAGDGERKIESCEFEKDKASEKEMKWFEEVPRWMKWFEATLVYAAALSFALWILSFVLFFIGVAIEKLGEVIGVPDPVPEGGFVRLTCGWSLIMRGWSKVFKGFSFMILSFGYCLLYAAGAIMTAWFESVLSGDFSAGTVTFVRSVFWWDGRGLSDLFAYILARILFPFTGIGQVWSGICDMYWGYSAIIDYIFEDWPRTDCGYWSLVFAVLGVQFMIIVVGFGALIRALYI